MSRRMTAITVRGQIILQRTAEVFWKILITLRLMQSRQKKDRVLLTAL